MIKITKGLNLPIVGKPEQVVYEAPRVTEYALLGDDYVNLSPSFQVKIGDYVKKGQTLFTDKNDSAVCFTSPSAGTVKAIHRGARRAFQSIVILSTDKEDAITFDRYPQMDLLSLKREDVLRQLLESGLFTAIRQRPYSKIPHSTSKPNSIFVSLVDTNPLAPHPEKIIEAKKDMFFSGLKILSRLTEGKIFLCKEAESKLTLPPDLSFVHVEDVAGVHPAGNVGTHIFYLDPIFGSKEVWYVGYQDVCAMGELFCTGVLSTERIIAIVGDRVERPRLLKTNLGVSLDDLLKHQLIEGENRLISGTVFSGRNALAPYSYLGRYHNQVTVLREGTERVLLGWQRPGCETFSIQNLFASRLFKGRKFLFSTTTHGSPRSLVPIGAYEKIMPLDIMPTVFLKALLVKDTEMVQALGGLALDEEDLALCTFACPSKYDFGKALRENLKLIEKDG